MSEEITSEALIERCANGDSNSLRLLYERTSAHLFGLLRRILLREDLAQEALQEVYVSIWRNAASYSASKGTAYTWMVSIARYRAIDIRRSRRFEVQRETFDDIAVESDSPEGDPLLVTTRDADAARLNTCLDELDAAHRNAVRLAFLNGLTHQEVAAHLDKPLGTIKSWIRRGLASLKDCLLR